MPSAAALTVTRLPPDDIVAMAQCIAIDTGAFPHQSSQFVLRPVGAPVWVARDVHDAQAGRVLGFLAASRRRPRELYVDGLATAPHARHRGVGRALLHAAIAYAAEAGLDGIALHVWAGNTAAVDLYRSEGFDVVEDLPRFYSRGAFASTHAYRMVRSRSRTASAR
jgi:ribosomal protein S18 acetylase RimI-like enzyme